MNITSMALMVLIPIFLFLIYSLVNIEYAYSLGLKTDDICLICDVFDNFGDLVRFQ